MMLKLVNGIFAFVIVTLAAALWYNWETSHFEYQCGYCGEVFSLSTWQGLFAPHIMAQKLVRCPRCGRMTWTTPVRKDQ